MHFNVEARTINERVRELVLAGRWPDAQRFLRKCLPSMTTDQAYQVMSGKTRFVNVGQDGRATDGASIDLAFAESVDAGPDPETEAYAAECDRRWGNALRRPDGFYVPYAYVTNFGINDLPPDVFSPQTRAIARYVSDNSIEAWSPRHRQYLGRPIHYMDDLESDRAFDLRPREGMGAEQGLPYDVPVLFRRLDGVPPWVEAATSDPSIALDLYLAKGGKVVERGHMQRYGDVQRPWFSRQASSTPAEVDPEPSNEDARLAKELSEAAKRVRAQMAMPGRGGRIPMMVGKRVIEVPQAPFEHWALDRCGAGHLAPPWDVCSRPGLKAGMIGSTADDPMHTDWMLGAGLDPLKINWYGNDPDVEALKDEAFKLMGEIQGDRLEFSCTVLAGNGVVSGRVYVARPGRDEDPEPGDVVVLPDASAKWLDTVVAACVGGSGAVVVAQGGAVAHLVNVSRARGTMVVRVEDAHRLYVDGQTLTVDCTTGKVNVAPVDLDPDVAGGLGFN